LNSRGQFSIIAALFVAVILIATVIVTYSNIRDTLVRDQPLVQSAIDETNFAIKQVLGFTVGYYGSVLQVTGNRSYARTLAINYLRTGLVNVAEMHPEWGPSFDVSTSELSAFWFTNTSYSSGNLAVMYNLTGLGIFGITYESSCMLKVQIMGAVDNQAWLNVIRDEDEPVINLGKQNFRFLRYENATWVQVRPSTEPVAYANGTYQVDFPSGVDPTSYILQVEDPRGIVVVGSSFSQYTFTVGWNSTAYSSMSSDSLVVELMQNGTMRWLGQNLNFTTAAKPVPPVAVKAMHLNQTIDNVNQEVPFQVEDWNYNYQVPAGLTNNATVFGNRQMIVFLANRNVSKITLWWDGHDTANQTQYAFVNRYFRGDDPANGVLTNGNMSLLLQDSVLYVDGYDSTNHSWSHSGASPYLHDDDGSYISHNSNREAMGWFTFRDLASNVTQALGSAKVYDAVRIEFECKRSADDYFGFLINDGATAYGPFNITGMGGNWGWISYDLSSIINTSAQINDAKITTIYWQYGSSASTVSIRRCRLSVDLWLTSAMQGSSSHADFMRINRKAPTYGSNLAYVIHHGVVRDVIHQEAEWSQGIAGCPNVYSQLIITLPAKSTYYTYQLRLMFVESQRARNITDMCPIRIITSPGQAQTENGTSSGTPVVATEGVFYNYSATSSPSETAWAHHWAQLISDGKGAGIMFCTGSNERLYAFDGIAGGKTGALNTTASAGTIEFSPVATTPANFTKALDITWHGAVANFDATTPIYTAGGGNPSGLWLLVEYPPTIAVNVEG